MTNTVHGHKVYRFTQTLEEFVRNWVNDLVLQADPPILLGIVVDPLQIVLQLVVILNPESCKGAVSTMHLSPPALGSFCPLHEQKQEPVHSQRHPWTHIGGGISDLLRISLVPAGPCLVTFRGSTTAKLCPCRSGAPYIITQSVLISASSLTRLSKYTTQTLERQGTAR